MSTQRLVLFRPGVQRLLHRPGQTDTRKKSASCFLSACVTDGSELLLKWPLADPRNPLMHLIISFIIQRYERETLCCCHWSENYRGCTKVFSFFYHLWLLIWKESPVSRRHEMHWFFLPSACFCLSVNVTMSTQTCVERLTEIFFLRFLL